MPSNVEPLIRARGLTKRFANFTAVDTIDFDVHPGEAFGFLGPNGAGKTSTMRMIGCASPVTAGTLQGMGMDPADKASKIKARLRGGAPTGNPAPEPTAPERLLQHPR